MESEPFEFIIRNNIKEIKTIILSIEYNVIYNYVCRLSPSLFQKALLEINSINHLCKSIMDKLLYDDITDSKYIINYLTKLINKTEIFAFKVENGHYDCTCCTIKNTFFEQFEEIIYILDKTIIYINKS